MIKDPYLYDNSEILINFFNEHNDKKLREIEADFSNIDWDRLSLEEKAMDFSKNTAKLWKIHPFREGNTRTIITFVCDFADKHGFKINRSLLEKNSIYLRTSLVAANAVFKDIGDKSQIQYLYNIIFDALKKAKEL